MDLTKDFRGRLLPINEHARLAILGLVLAAIVYFVFFHESSEPTAPVSPVIVETPYVPRLDPEILAKVADGTRNERIPVEHEPLAHLLEKSLEVVPAVTKALGLPETPVPFDVLRADPGRFRGRYLWYKGRLESLSAGADGHPVRGYRIHEARLQTQEGEQVLFHFSLPPKDLTIGDWVRAEGFFLKLRDSHFPVLTQAPLLVGPELLKAFPDWQPVEQLDPAVLAAIKDGIREGGMDLDLQDATQRLPFAQDVPLWHLASYARHQWATRPREELATAEVFERKEQWTEVFEGRMQRGRPFKLYGLFLRAHVIAAKPNPLGIEYWSEVWLLNRAFGTRPFAVWVPIRVGEWRHSETATATGYFLKRYVVPGGTGEQHFSPLFVAADVERVDFSPDEAVRVIGIGAGVLTGLLAILFWFASRRDRRASEAHARELAERRRRRRHGAVSPT